MTIRTFENKTPQIASSAFIDPTAVIIGDVKIGEDSSIWPHTVVRGDILKIRIGQRTSIQDNSVMHVTHAGKFNPDGFATIIGNDVTVGHRVILHGCEIKDKCLIGMGSIIMDDVVIESNVLLGAGSLVTPGKVLESGYLWMGAPVKKVRPLTEKEFTQIKYSANYYVELKNRYRSVL